MFEFMKKIVRISGIIGYSGLFLGGWFKIFHLMGAPSLWLLGNIFTGVFLLTYAIDKLRKRF